jgi:RNA-directed DNA polymerase
VVQTFAFRSRHVNVPKPGTAAKLVLEPIFEADLDPAAYGYRPKRGVGQAIQTVLGLLRQGYTDVVPI